MTEHGTRTTSGADRRRTPPEVPGRPDLRRPLGELLALRAQEHPDRVLLEADGAAWTYEEMVGRAGRLAAALRRTGVGRGDRVALMLPNGVEFLDVMFASARLGAVEVPVNTAYKGQLLEYVLADSGAVAVVVHGRWLERLAAVLAAAPAVSTVLVVGDQPDGVRLPPGVVEVPYDDCLAGDDVAAAEPCDYTDLSAIMYTSGTTGPSKGVAVTHGHATWMAYDWLDTCGYTADDRLFSCLPLFHSIARTLGVVPVLLTGTTLCLAPRFSASAFWSQCRAADATYVHGIFGMVPILLKQPPSPDDRAHRVRGWYTGPSALAAAFLGRFGVHVVEIYGATETGIVTRQSLTETRPGSCGRVNEGTFEIRVADADDQPVGVGEIGEVLVRPAPRVDEHPGVRGEAGGDGGGVPQPVVPQRGLRAHRRRRLRLLRGPQEGRHPSARGERQLLRGGVRRERPPGGAGVRGRRGPQRRR